MRSEIEALEEHLTKPAEKPVSVPLSGNISIYNMSFQGGAEIET